MAEVLACWFRKELHHKHDTAKDHSCCSAFHESVSFSSETRSSFPVAYLLQMFWALASMNQCSCDYFFFVLKTLHSFLTGFFGDLQTVLWLNCNTLIIVRWMFMDYNITSDWPTWFLNIQV